VCVPGIDRICSLYGIIPDSRSKEIPEQFIISEPDGPKEDWCTNKVSVQSFVDGKALCLKSAFESGGGV